MASVLKFRRFDRRRPADLRSLGSELLSAIAPQQAAGLLRTIAWISAGAGALALGLFVGRELRSRYKFSRRTPYDFYAHAGDSQEFGVGI
jgi:hypothetical protein